MAAPEFSIITVSLNAAATIDATLESVRAQSWRPLESVVVDGGSKDGTLAVVERYGDVVASLSCGPDGGIYEAMNKGLARARGEIVHFLNADDRFVDGTVLAAVAAVFQAEPGLDLVFGDAVYVQPDGRFLHRFERVTARNLLFRDLCHQAVFARRSLFSRFGGFDPVWRINADYDWLLRVFLGGANMRHLPRPVVYYDAAGCSAADPEFTRDERRRVRLQYARPLAYRAGDLIYRIARKARKLGGRLECIPYEQTRG